jgi:hypothetical protein
VPDPWKTNGINTDKEKTMTALSTSDVLDRHLNSFAKYDLAGILADYSSDAVLFTPTGPRSSPSFRPSFLSLQAGLLVHDAAPID